MAKTPVSKIWRLPRKWNGRYYSQSSDAPDVPSPSSLSASSNGTAVTLTWTDESAGSSGTVIQRSANGSTGWSDVATALAGAETATDTAPSGGTWYYRAYGIYSGTRSGTPSSNANVTVAAVIPPPTSFAATVNSYDIVLTWNDESGGTAQHVIQSSADGVSSWSTVATKATGVETHTVTSLSDGTYYYRIYAYISPDSSSYLYANATIDTPLSAPSSFSAVASGTTVNFSWVDNNAGAAQTRIEESTTSESAGFSTLVNVTAGLEAHEETGVSVGAHWYRALAVDGVDTSPTTSVVAVNVSAGGGSDGIASITGTISDGATVTINGAGFGTMGGDVISFMYGTEGADGTQITAATPTIGSAWGAQSGGNCLFSNARTRGGRARSMRKWRTNPSGTTVNFCGFGPNNINQTSLFFSFWRHASMDIAWTTTGTNYKMYYIFTDGAYSGVGGSEKPQPIFYVQAGGSSFRLGSNGGSGDAEITQSLGWNATNSLGAWQYYENWMVLNSDYDVQDGAVEISKDCAIGISDHTYAWYGAGPTWTTKPTAWQDIRIGHYDQGMTGFVADYSDMYVANTRARVVLGNASTYSACTAREIQLARQANWGATAISSVTINYGGFSSGQTAYMYVVKSDGSVVSNSGYAVVLP